LGRQGVSPWLSVGPGAAEGATDAANIMKPQLARGELRAIGATTLDEYRKHIEKDPALERRFQPVFVSEPTVEVICDDMPHVVYGNVDDKTARRIVREHLAGKALVSDHIFDKPSTDIIKNAGL
jgi:(2Fe-2S) ferredoxin